ncbi:MAG: 50S ribosomal protein L20 [bacterium]
MARVKGGSVSKTRRRKVLKEAKGYFGSKHRLYKTAQEQVFHSGEYAYRDRKANKRNFRKLWITRINAACRLNGVSYSVFINGLSKAGVEINRKMLSELAISDPNGFTALVNMSKSALGQEVTAPKAAAKTEVKKAETKKVEEKAPAKKAEKKETTDLSGKTLAELKELAKEKGITGYSTLKKAELIEKLS